MKQLTFNLSRYRVESFVVQLDMTTGAIAEIELNVTRFLDTDERYDQRNFKVLAHLTPVQRARLEQAMQNVIGLFKQQEGVS